MPRLGGSGDRSTNADVDFSWANLAYKVMCETESERPDGSTANIKDWKKLLSGVTGTARGGRLMAIMGPSGAGKTTLLNALAGRLTVDDEHTIDGCAYLNSTVLTNEHKRSMAFVAQDDIVMANDTPREALYFSCRMRLGCDHEEALRRTSETLERLRIEECADTRLGAAGLVKGVSGGERKRTNIGSELITNPLILLLDEATTGLDSVSALRIGETLRELAHSLHRTVICTIHSPSSALYQVFDDILLLAKGHVVYHGPVPEAVPYFAGVGYPLPEQTNPSEYFMKLLQLPDEQLDPLIDAWEKYASSSAAASNLSISRARSFVTGASTDGKYGDALPPVRKEGAGVALQFSLLVRRSMRNFLRDARSSVGRLLQTIFLGVLIGLFFWGIDKDMEGVQDRTGVLFMMALNTVIIGVMNGLVTFPSERAVFLMEQANDAYNPVVYFIAKTIAETPFQLLFPMIYVAIAYYMIALVPSADAFFTTMLIIVAAANAAYSFGIMLSCFFPRAEIAMIFAPVVLLPMVLVGGLMANTERLEPEFTWLTHISFVRYAYRPLCINEFGKVGSLCPANGTCPYRTGDEVLKFLGFDDGKWGIDILCQLLLMLTARIVAASALAYQGYRLRAKLSFAQSK